MLMSELFEKNINKKQYGNTEANKIAMFDKIAAKVNNNPNCTIESFKERFEKQFGETII